MLLCLVPLLLLNCNVDGVGVKQRLAAYKRGQDTPAHEDTPASASASSSSTYERKGGLKRRLDAAASARETQEVPLAHQSSNPLFRDFKKSWAKGKLSSADVQQFAASAAAVGAGAFWARTLIFQFFSFLL